jgi:hypothetical protein
MKGFWISISMAVLLLTGFDACNKDTSIIDDNDPKIDAKLIAPWYNRVDSVGFEVFPDGSTKTLSVDTAGKLQYMPAKDTLKRGTIVLNILKTVNGDIHLKITYRIPRFIDTTVSVVGQYEFSNNEDTLKLTVPEPTTAKPTLVTYIRSFIGALVAPKP